VKNRRQVWLELGIALLATLFVVAPLLRSWTIAGQSTTLELVRLEAMRAAVAGGDWWPRWLPDLYGHHGSPLPLFYAPLSYQLPLALALLGLGNSLALQIAMSVHILAGAIGAGWASRRWFGPGSEAVAALAFALAPYVLFDVYARFAYAELGAIALLPWLLGLVTVGGPRGAAGLGLGVAALVLTHNITALVATPLVFLLALAGGGRDRWLRLWAIAAGVGLAAFFWIPALALRGEVWAEESLTAFKPVRHLRPLLAILPFGDGEIVDLGSGRRAGARLGEPGWLLLALAPWLAARAPRRRRPGALVLAAAGLAAVLLTASFTAPFWEHLPLVRYVQFPFRLLGVASVVAALFAGALAARARERFAIAPLLLVALLPPLFAWAALGHVDCRYAFLDASARTMVVVAPSQAPRAAADPRLAAPDRLLDVDYLRREVLSSTSGEDFLPRTAQRPPRAAAVAAEAISPGVEVTSSEWGYPEVRAEIVAARPGGVALSQLAFPGWRVEVDGAPRETLRDRPAGRIVVPVRPGDRRIVARFGWTPLTRAAGATSLLSALALLLLALRKPDAAAEIATR